jgi:hypothetical protein
MKKKQLYKIRIGSEKSFSSRLLPRRLPVRAATSDAGPNLKNAAALSVFLSVFPAPVGRTCVYGMTGTTPPQRHDAALFRFANGELCLYTVGFSGSRRVDLCLG